MRTTYRRRRIAVGLLAVALVASIFVGYSLGTFLVNPAYGTSLSARVAEWARAVSYTHLTLPTKRIV